MAKLTHWLRNHLPTQRRLIQLYAALLYNAHLKGYISGNIYTGSTKSVCVPGFNCYSCPGAVGACPLGALQNAIASSGSRTPVYVLGILLLYGITLGRTICGFLCPVGLLQELLHKIPSFKVKKGRVTRVLSYLKYVILAIFVILVPLWYALHSRNGTYSLQPVRQAPLRAPSACCPIRPIATSFPCWASSSPANL